MAAPFDNIVQHLFHQPSLHSVTVDELEHMAKEHPYFAAAHFLLLKKMQETDHPSFADQLHRTTLYFNNPLWLQFLLQPDTVAGFAVSDRAPFIVDEAGSVEEAVSSAGDNEAPVHSYQHNDDGATVDPTPALPEAPPEQQEDTVPDSGADKENMMDVVAAVFADPVAKHETTIENREEPTPAVTIEEPQEPLASFQAEDASPIDHKEQELNEEASAESQITVAEETAVTETTTVVPDRQDSAEELAAPGSTTEDSPADLADAEMPTEADIHNPAISTPEQPSEMAAAEAAGLETGDDNPPPEPAADAHSFPPLLRPMVETTATAADHLFEPYHTVDYFASQGIKLSKAEADAKDKLGRKLRSFTEWLKTMKKLPPASLNQALAQEEDSQVVQDAIHSIENKEVITEAMAEVFEKQGLRDKARLVYEKLSLLNPDKSAYFAARIDALKQ